MGNSFAISGASSNLSCLAFSSVKWRCKTSHSVGVRKVEVRLETPPTPFHRADHSDGPAVGMIHTWARCPGHYGTPCRSTCSNWRLDSFQLVQHEGCSHAPSLFKLPLPKDSVGS